MFRCFLGAMSLFAICLTTVAEAQQKPTREQQVRKDKKDFAENEAWFYDDLEAAKQEAAKTKRPLMIVFR